MIAESLVRFGCFVLSGEEMENKGVVVFLCGAARYDSHVGSYGDDQRAHDMPTNGQMAIPKRPKDQKEQDSDSTTLVLYQVGEGQRQGGGCPYGFGVFFARRDIVPDNERPTQSFAWVATKLACKRALQTQGAVAM